jgi:hypothetical protein
MVGTTVCIIHGGKAPQTLDRAAGDVVLAQLDDPRLRELAPRLSRTEQLADARYSAWVWMRFYHNAASDAVLAGERPDPDDVRSAQLGARNVARIGKLEADIGVDEEMTRRLELEGRLLVLVVDAVASGLAGTLPAPHAERLHLWMMETARDRLLALNPKTVGEAEAVTVDPASPPFRLMLAPAIEGEVVPSSNPADEDTRPGRLGSRDTARVSSIVDLDTRRRVLDSLSDDELAEEIERRHPDWKETG